MWGSHVEEIKSRLPIDEIIGSYVTLSQKGKYLSARCPFHNEKSASFYVSPDRGTYYCFGCGEKGDIFSFVERYEGLDFRGALEELARRAGVTLKPVSKQEVDQKEIIYSCLKDATKFFEENLLKEKDALDYLKSRNLKPETIKNFKIGYADNSWNSLTDHLKSLNYTDDTIVRCGLAIKSEKENINGSTIYNRFRGRIMFPIEDSAGRVIGYSGRILPQLDDGKTGKYINSPETEVYHKSNILYGFSHAKQYIRKHDFSVVVEGQFDVVLSHQSGFPNTVAVSGTAFSGDTINETGVPTHLGLLSRLSKNMILALDNDEAGRKAKIRVLDIALPIGINIKLIKNLPGAKDPADILSTDGGIDIWKNILREAQPPIESLCQEIINKNDVREKSIQDVKKEILPLIAIIPSAVDRQEAARIVEKYFSINIDFVLKDVDDLIKKQNTNSTVSADNVVITDLQNENKTSIKEKFYGIYFASQDINSQIYTYRDKIRDFVKENIPIEILNKEELGYKPKIEELSLQAEIDFDRATNKEPYINELILIYEENVIRDIVNQVKAKLVNNENNIELIKEYQILQQKIEIIRQKRRNT